MRRPLSVLLALALQLGSWAPAAAQVRRVPVVAAPVSATAASASAVSTVPQATALAVPAPLASPLAAPAAAAVAAPVAEAQAPAAAAVSAPVAEAVAAEAAAETSGRSALESQIGEGRARFDNAAPSWRSAALSVILLGSMAVSRTAVVGRRTFASQDVPVAEVAQRNFERTAKLVVERHADLPLTKATAVKLNRDLTEGLVPEGVRGDPDFHRDTARFYEWLESEEAAELGRKDPLELAQQIHYKMSRNDSFPDGNGRTARLMADLALLRHGLPPAFYTDMSDYFARGNHRSKVSPEARRAYFKEIVERGGRAMKDPAQLKPAQLDPDFLRAVSGDALQNGLPLYSRRDHK